MKVQIKGPVESFAQVSPKFVRLTGPAGQKIVRKVTIIPNEKYPFKIVRTKADPASDNFSYKVEKGGPEKPGAYILTVENKLEDKGNYFGTIALYTNNPARKVLKVKVHGTIYVPLAKKPGAPASQGKAKQR